MEYEHVFATLSPKFLSLKDILVAFPEKFDTDTYYKHTNFLEISEDILSQLIETGLLKKEGKLLTKIKEFSEFIKFLKNNNIENSVIKNVSWTVWYLYNKGLNSFRTSEVLNELLICKAKEADIIWAERILKRLKLDFKDGSWHVNNESLAKIRENLKEKVSEYWSAFCSYYVKNTKYFKISRGISNKLYVDVPNKIIVYGLASELIKLDNNSNSAEEFYEDALDIINSYNNQLKKEEVIEKLFGKNIDWLSFRLQKNKI